MPRRAEDVTGWIAYSDFLTTLAVLFLLLAILATARVPPSDAGFVAGRILAPAGGAPDGGCLVMLGASRQLRTPVSGEFQMRVDSVPGHVGMVLRAECRGYEDFEELIQIRTRDTVAVVIELVRQDVVADSNVARIHSLPGDALFQSNAFRLTPAGVTLVQRLGRELADSLQAGEVLLVQGHTDDVPFRDPVAGRDNWVLSGQRAAAAARILTAPAYGVNLPECRVATMGFGPSRPVAQVLPTDSRVEIRDKRSRNRRIEFRRVQGSELTSGSCE